jgi:nitrogen fixation NifU-like protein
VSAFPPAVLEHFRRPHNRGRLDAPDAWSEGANPLCGDRVRIELAVADDRIAAARFQGDACAVTIAAASLLTSRVVGMTLREVESLGDADVIELLGGPVPDARRRCATLPLDVLHAALEARRP